jgi:hypothetical protein
MKTSIGALLVLALIQPTMVQADGGWRGPYHGSGVVVGGYYGPRGGYYGGGWGYRGPGVGVYLGAPLYWGAPWGPPAYYSPPVIYPQVIAVPPPVVYVERDEAIAPLVSPGGALEPGYWYYCREKGAYYPAVTQCPSAWQKVAPVNH